MFLVFLSHLGRAPETEAAPVAELLGLDAYDVRLALKAPAPIFLAPLPTRTAAMDAVGRLRARGHGAEALDEELVVPASQMITMSDFRLGPDGITTARERFLPYGDALALLLAWHERAAPKGEAPRARSASEPGVARARMSDATERKPVRERVLYIFRRSGETPWLVRELHTNYSGLGADRATTARDNFRALTIRLRELSPLASFDERLLSRKVAERAMLGSVLRTSAEAIDLMAHMLAMTLAAQTQSPYR